MNFRKIIKAIQEIKNCYEENLNAFEKDHKKKITLNNPSLCEGSINLDNCVVRQYPNEFHPATTHDISDILKKLEWLKTWLNKEENKELKKRNAKNPYYWIASGGIKIFPRTPQYKQVAKQGVLPKKDLSLD